jgi:hypothetical protein
MKSRRERRRKSKRWEKRGGGGNGRAKDGQRESSDSGKLLTRTWPRLFVRLMKEKRGRRRRWLSSANTRCFRLRASSRHQTSSEYFSRPCEPSPCAPPFPVLLLELSPFFSSYGPLHLTEARERAFGQTVSLYCALRSPLSELPRLSPLFSLSFLPPSVVFLPRQVPSASSSPLVPCSYSSPRPCRPVDVQVE